jgi:uncharacterized protein YqgC (DUF456 family)
VHWLYYLLLLGMTPLCIVLAVFNLPGLWLMAALAATYDWLTGWNHIIQAKIVIGLVVMAAVAELIDFFAASAGARKAGGGAYGMIGAIIGGIAGGLLLTIPLPAIGTVLGICIGCFLGALAGELLGGKSVRKSVKIGFGAAKGRLVGIIVKLVIGITMIVVLAIGAFP